MKIKNVIKLLLLVILLSIFGTWWYLEYGKKLEPIINDEGIIKRPYTLDGETISSGIKEMGELNTAEYFFERVEDVTSNKKVDLTELGINIKFDIPLTTNGFRYSYAGEIKAGIDFNNIEVDVDDNNKTIIIIIPKTKILSSIIDPDSYKFYEINNNLINPISPEDYAISLADLIHKEEENAIEKGLLDKAEKNAEKIIKNYVNSFNEKKYKIVINSED